MILLLLLFVSECINKFSVVLALIITEVSKIAAKTTAASRGSPEVKELWMRLQLYALVLLSLALNCVLIALGYLVKNRKGKTWVVSLTHLSFFFGDLVATTATTTLLKGQLNGKTEALQIFWAPFLLLHLGSAETIAAHIRDEKNLWQTYMLGLIIQSGMACYILMRFERGTVLSYIAIPIFVAGFLKCMERIWILRFSGFKQFVNSALSETPPKMLSTSKGLGKDGQEQLDDHLTRKPIIPQGIYLHRAYLSFKMFVPLFADIDLRIYKQLSNIFNLKPSVSAEEAFQMVATELDFLYDVLYTKTVILDIVLGFTFRFIYFLSSIGALLAFYIDANISNQHHSKVEIYITYFLLYGACFADSIAVFSHLLSNWTLVCITSPNTWQRLPKCLHSPIAYYLKLKRSTQQGVKFMAQHSLLNYCLKAKVNKFNAAISKMVGAKKISKLFWNVQQRAWVDVRPTWALLDADLKDLIFSRLQQKRREYQEKEFKFSRLSRLANKGASDVLKDKGPEIQWSVNKVEFTHSLILWHIATDILFHYYERIYPGCTRRKYHRVSKKLSDYMMHLLVVRSVMLHSGISKLRYRDTCFEAMNFFGPQMRMESEDLGKAAMTVLGLDIESRIFLSEVRGAGGKSVFFEGCKLAQQLKSLAEIERYDPEELWEMISSVWMEMLFSAAYDCDWKEHAYQLGHGGELLTHVALLMAHLGLSKHLRMTKLPKEYDYKEYGYNPPWDWDHLDQMAYYLA